MPWWIALSEDNLSPCLRNFETADWLQNSTVLSILSLNVKSKQRYDIIICNEKFAYLFDLAVLLIETRKNTSMAGGIPGRQVAEPVDCRYPGNKTVAKPEHT